jgi:hypothetical protein
MLPVLYARLGDNVEWVVQRWLVQCSFPDHTEAAEIIDAVYQGLHMLATAVSQSAEETGVRYRFPRGMLHIRMTP